MRLQCKIVLWCSLVCDVNDFWISYFPTADTEGWIDLVLRVMATGLSAEMKERDC